MGYFTFGAILTDVAPLRFSELHAQSCYSFLRGASYPQELVTQAIELGHRGIAIVDRNGFYGIPKAYQEARKHAGFKLVVGCELEVTDGSLITFLVKTIAGYQILSELITFAHSRGEKGKTQLDALEIFDFFSVHPKAGDGLFLSLDGNHFPDWQQKLSETFFRHSRFLRARYTVSGQDADHFAKLSTQAALGNIPVVATCEPLMHHKSRKPLQDLLTAIREIRPVSQLGSLGEPNSERVLKPLQQLERAYREHPEWLSQSEEILRQCTFSMQELQYRYPSEWIPPGLTPLEHLKSLIQVGADERYPEGIPKNVHKQLQHELKLIEQLKFEHYFLTIWDIVQYARNQGILCQGRGSAANSVVCYCLGITAIDPVQMNLLFERFLSLERNEPPDIDVDFEHERREEVLQYVYTKYGRDRAAMVCTVVTFRSRSAKNEVDKFLPELDQNARAALVQELKGFPRHLSIHSGGFTLSSGSLVHTVPIEPARMEGRTVVQWDKDDLELLGLLKVDLLSLGMLTAIQRCLKLVGISDMYRIPADDPPTYQMIQRGETLGVFQIESRAQIGMVTRLLPKNFYDLVVEVAIVRPGPIVGKMVHPYLRRRQGLEPVVIPDERLRPILEKTLGVPLFQEQVMKMAITLANFTPGEADELRRSIGAWKTRGSMEKMGTRLMTGLLAQGLPTEYVKLIFAQIQGFSEYGFPESHAASFALLAYISSYLKCHHPAEFLCALLNSQPMGFYSAHSLIDEAKRSGVRILPLDLQHSQWECTMEAPTPLKMAGATAGAVRIGFSYLQSVGKPAIEAFLSERTRQPFTHLRDFLSRTRFARDEYVQLARADLFEVFGKNHREALWEVLLFEAEREGLFAGLQTTSAQGSLFAPPTSHEVLMADYETQSLSTRAHLMQLYRARLQAQSRAKPRPLGEIKSGTHGSIVQASGLAIILQRPPTAKNFTFVTLEDESAVLDLIINPKVYEQYAEQLHEAAFITAQGKLQRDAHSVSLWVHRLSFWNAQKSRLKDFSGW